MDTEENILNFVSKSTAKANSKLQFVKIEENIGWVNITAKTDDSEFPIKYSSCLFDTSDLINFFMKLTDLEKNIAIFLDREGSYPMLYAEKIDNNTLRFMFAHDYETFMNDETEDICIQSYKIECDIIIDKRTLLKEFYDILYPFTMHYNPEEAYFPEFDIEKAKKYLNKINEFTST